MVNLNKPSNEGFSFEQTKYKEALLEKQHEEPPMKTQFNQPQGSTSRETNKEAIARIFGLKKSQVGYLSTSTPIDSYVILFDKETQTCWYRGTATGTPISWSVNDKTIELVTTEGSFTIQIANIFFKFWVR